MAKRDEFTKETKSVLRERVLGVCSRTECGRVTVTPDPKNPSKLLITGRAAHITAAQPNGPRFNKDLSSTQRRHALNGIWLCTECADLVDKNDGRGFSVEQLRTWKRTAEGRVLDVARLRVRARRPTWLDRLGTPHYVNVPRVLHLAGSDALNYQALTSLENGFPRARSMIRELIEVENALRHLSIEAVDVEEIFDIEQLSVGVVLSFHQSCRTKNANSEDERDVKNYSFDKSPLIYLESNGIRYIQPYDPKWVTTSTAECTVRSGACTLAGIAMIKAIDPGASQVIASPLAFGIPDILGLFG